jgi:small-conductance mechanosensitive channel
METIVEYFQIPIVNKLIRTVLFFILCLSVILLSRRFIQSLKINKSRRQFFKKWATYIIFIIYGLILIHVWAVKDLFHYFENPIINKLMKSLLAFGLVYLALYFIRSLINSLKIEITKKHLYRTRVNYAATLIYFILLIPIWAGSMQQWATILSVIGAGVALALHEVLLNIAGWVYIVIRRPYRTGDRIELGEVQGDVIDIRLFQTTMLEIGNWVDGDQSTGRVVDLPHGQIFRKPLYNYTKGFEFLWNEISVMVTFESNWKKAEKILLKYGAEESQGTQETIQKKIDRMAREYLIYYKTFTPIVYVRIEDSGVKLTLRYLTDTKRRRSSENTIGQKVLSAYKKASNIDFAYPTYRIYKRGEDGNS